MHFKRYGTSYHPLIKTASDLQEALQLDESLWVSTSAPIRAFRMDPEFLKYLDSDLDSRVKCGELEEATHWLFAMLKEHSGISEASTTLKLEHLQEQNPEALEIISLLKQIAPGKTAVELKEIRQWRKRLEEKPVSETGVVLPDASSDEKIRSFLKQLIDVTGGVAHPSGKKGVDRNLLDAFQKSADARKAWQAQLLELDENGCSKILPLGEDTPAAFAIYQTVKGAIEHFFRLCDAVNLDPAALQQSWPGLPKELNWEDATALDLALRNAPIAAPNEERILRFNKEINPAWARDLHDFRQQVIVPLFDRTDEVMTPQTWKELCVRMDEYGRWKDAEAGKELSSISETDLISYSQPALRDAVLALMDHQAKSAIDLKDVRRAEKLALYQGYILEFSNNFIAFPHLYEPEIRAGFEMGTLIMDGRRFNLSVEVPDRAAYLKGIEGGTMFIMIVELVHTLRKEKFEVAVPATSGHQGNLKVGKHGVFQHVDGSQWFATVVHIADNPISLGEAMMEPFKRLGKAVTQKVESITQSAEKKLEQSGADAVTKIQSSPEPTPAPASSGNMLAGGGIAIAALGSSFAFITKIFAGLQPADVLKGLLAAVLAVMIPSSIIAWIRLSKRDLSVLLEGAGWAINSRMRLNQTQCRTFTCKPSFPEGSRLIRGREWWLWRILWIEIALYMLLKMWR
ncbi:hypothetical protein P3T73_09135 [Kiritimatiellota bacterium B12222]|nr:hypothetical protein P3T73_09135 [Kiritimatiellota bacterium B12222]